MWKSQTERTRLRLGLKGIAGSFRLSSKDAKLEIPSLKRGKNSVRSSSRMIAMVRACECSSEGRVDMIHQDGIAWGLSIEPAACSCVCSAA